MRYLALGVILLLSTAGAVRADSGLTGAVAATFLVRNVDAGLHEIAHARVAEISAAGGLEHDGMRPGTAEVLAWNAGDANPVGNAVSQWIESPTHNAILSNASYGRIGCAEAVVAETHWFACVLAEGPLPQQVGSAPASGTQSQTFALPDTSMPPPELGGAAARRRLVPR